MDIVKIPRDFYLPRPPELPVASVIACPPDGTPPKDDYTFIPHVHDFVEIVAILSGTGTQWINGAFFPVLRGDVFLLRGDTAHCFTEHKGLRLCNILYVPEAVPLPYDLCCKMSGYQMFFLAEPLLRNARNNRCGLHLSPEVMQTLESMICQMQELSNIRDEGFEVRKLVLLLEIILMLSENGEDKLADADGAFSKIVSVIGRMEKEPINNWTLTTLAKLACTSPRNFLRLFNKVTGTSPMNYLCRLRLIRAAEFLRHGYSVSHAAEYCGFKDTNYFGKKFKKLHGMSPHNFSTQSKVKVCHWNEQTQRFDTRRAQN